MQPAPKADQARTIEHFHVYDEADAAPAPRSTIEPYASCPQRGVLLEKTPELVGDLANVGEESHQALAQAVLDHIASSEGLRPHELAQSIETRALQARPDVQPEVIRATKWVAHQWSKHIYNIHPANIVAFDEGETIDRSGQLTFTVAGVNVTCELDFLHIHGVEAFIEDYKTGWKRHDDVSIADSFQFAVQAAAVFTDWEEVQRVFVRVWNTRLSNITPWVEFRRDRHFGPILQRIAQTVLARNEALAADAAGKPVAAWPSREKCSTCPVVAQCSWVKHGPPTLISGPESAQVAAKQLIVYSAAVESLKEDLARWVDQHGEIVTDAGDVVGRNKPSAERKKPLAVYSRSE